MPRKIYLFDGAMNQSKINPLSTAVKKTNIFSLKLGVLVSLVYHLTQEKES